MICNTMPCLGKTITMPNSLKGTMVRNFEGGEAAEVAVSGGVPEPKPTADKNHP